MRITVRLLSVLVIVSAVIVAWARSALVCLYGPQETAVFMWTSAGGTLCAVVALIRTRRAVTRNTRNDQARGAA